MKNPQTKSSNQQGFKFINDYNIKMSNKTLTINKSLFIKTIKNLKNEESLPSIRSKICKLIEQLSSYKNDKIGLLNIDSNGDTVQLKEKFIHQELKQIIESKTLDRAIYYLERFEKSLSEKRTNKINDINLNRWKEYEDIYTDSLWLLDSRDSTGVHTAGYWGNFIPQIPHQMLKRYTKKEEWVLDTFAGCGTTLIEAQRLGRNCVGIEIQDKITERANKLIHSEPNKYKAINKVITGDSLSVDYQSILREYNQKSVQLLIMHPPYYDIIKFSSDPKDLSNAPTVKAFLEMMSSVIEKASAVLDKGRYFVLVIGDKYSKGEWIPLGFQTMNEVLKLGFSLKSIIVKNFEETVGKRNQKELWRYRALVGGFYIFKHEYIFLFKKVK